jgi:hypothetical protein
MALIGTFPGSASAVFNLDFLPELVVCGDPSSNTQNLSNFSVVCSGMQLMSVTDVDRLTALSKFDSGAILSDEPGNSVTASYTTITGTNSQVSTRDLFAASTNISNVARRAVEQSINPSANATFDNFEALFFLPANVLRAQITFANGFSDEYTPTELRALYSKYHVSDSGGNLEGLTCIDADSGAGLISQVVLFNSSAGSTVVLKTDYVQL